MTQTEADNKNTTRNLAGLLRVNGNWDCKNSLTTCRDHKAMVEILRSSTPAIIVGEFREKSLSFFGP